MSFRGDIEKAEKQLKTLDTVIKRSLPDAAETGANELEKEAERRAPVLTGKLKRSFGNRPGTAQEKTVPNSAVHVVYNSAFYAAPVEYGRYKRPFMRPAARAAQGSIARAMEKTVTQKTDRVI